MKRNVRVISNNDNKLTYGESHVMELSSITLIEGVFTKMIEVPEIVFVFLCAWLAVSTIGAIGRK